MSVQANTLHIDARERDGSTVLSRVRSEGLWRTSRAFREAGATRVVVSQLGPGMIRGDVFASSGTVGENAHLIVCGQMATRVLPGPQAVTAHAAWTVEADGSLDLRAEPVIVTTGATYRARLTIALAVGARCAVSEIVRCEPGASASIATIVERGGRHAAVDALRISSPHDGVGTLAIFGPCDRDVLDRAAAECRGVRVGIGTLRQGDVLVRAIGGVDALRSALTRLRTIACAHWGLRETTFATPPDPCDSQPDP